MTREAAIAKATGITLRTEGAETIVVEPGESWLKLIKNGTVLRPTTAPDEIPQPLNPLLIVTKAERY